MVNALQRFLELIFDIVAIKFMRSRSRLKNQVTSLSLSAALPKKQISNLQIPVDPSAHLLRFP